MIFKVEIEARLDQRSLQGDVVEAFRARMVDRVERGVARWGEGAQRQREAACRKVGVVRWWMTDLMLKEREAVLALVNALVSTHAPHSSTSLGERKKPDIRYDVSRLLTAKNQLEIYPFYGHMIFTVYS